jgi:Spy/CpxP family protein refolding chaperone
MKKLIFLLLSVSTLFFTGCASSGSTSSNDSEDYQEVSTINPKLNNKRLEKNLEKFAADLDLSKRQVKQIKKIEKRYARKDRKLSRNDDAKRRDHKQLAEAKREDIISVLSNEQQQKLEALSKKSRFSFDRIFGK